MVFTCQGIGDVSLLLPIILAVAVAKGMGDAFSDSFYDAIITLKKIPFLYQANFSAPSPSPHPPSPPHPHPPHPVPPPAHLPKTAGPVPWRSMGTRRSARARVLVSQA